MLTLSIRSALRLVAVMAALACGWIAIATEQKAHVAVCINATKGHVRNDLVAPSPATVSCQVLTMEYRGEVGTTWLVGPTIAMSLAIVAAIGFGLIAISPRQGSLLTFRWRRAVY